jgi:hypothetical protein
MGGIKINQDLDASLDQGRVKKEEKETKETVCNHLSDTELLDFLIDIHQSFSIFI